MTAALRSADGRLLDLPAHRWSGPATAVDRRLLSSVDGPVLDVGCGPGRHVLALAEAGTVTLGIDISLPALAVARDRGAPVLERSIFDRIPGAGRWRTALLLDGNVGIGGCPASLLRRVASILVARGGCLLVEVGDPSSTGVEWVRFESDAGAGPWFEWARVDLADLDRHAAGAGLELTEHWRDGDRGFARLCR